MKLFFQTNLKAALFLLLAFLGLTISSQAFAQTTILSLDGSKFQYKSTGGLYGVGWLLGGNGYIENSLTFPSTGSYQFQVQAYGSYAGGAWPRMEVRVDQKALGAVSVNSSTSKTFNFTLNVASGAHKIELAFTNDYYASGQDRNLWINHLNVITTISTTTTTMAPAPTTTTLPPPTTTTTTLAPPTNGTNAFYVSPQGSDSNPGTASLPFRTLARAQTAVRAINATMTADITVYLRGGTHYLSSSLNLTQLDSGFNGKFVHYAAYPGEKPVISGGTVLTGWTSVGNGVYKASAQGLNFREMFVNGTRVTRARWPNGSRYHTLKANDWSLTTMQFMMNPLPFTPAADGTGGGIEFAKFTHWAQANFRVGAVAMSGTTGYMTPMDPEKYDLFGTGDCSVYRANACISSLSPQATSGAMLENSMQFLDSPGEWYLNLSSNEVYYKARINENVLTSEFIVPRLQTLISALGTADQKVKNLIFEGLTFSHSAWIAPSQKGWIGNQAIAGQSYQIPEGVTFENADSILIRDNIFTHTAASALGFVNGVQNSAIERNLFVDIGGAGIAVGRSLKFSQSDRRLVLYNNAIRNNIVTQVGRQYTQTTGIFAGYVDTLTIENNEIMEMPYSGISLGWGWTYNTSDLKNNLVRRNHIHEAVDFLDDGAAIYSLSKQPGTVITENYIHDMIHQSQWEKSGYNAGGIYLDYGSSYLTISNNLIMNSPNLPTTDADRNGLNTWTGNSIDVDVPTIRQNAGPQGLSAALLQAKADLSELPLVSAHWTMDADSNQGSTLMCGGKRAFNSTTNTKVVGTMTGVTSVSGLVAGALSFANAGSKVSVPHYIGFDTAKFTWTAWVRPSQPSTTSTAPEWILSKNSNETTAGYFGLAIQGSDLDRHFSAYLNIGGGSANTQIVASLPGSVSTGNWYLVGMTYDGASLALYINGALVGSKYIGLPRVAGTGPLMFGQRADGVGTFSGLLDDVMVFDRAFTPAEMRKATKTHAAF